MGLGCWLDPPVSLDGLLGRFEEWMYSWPLENCYRLITHRNSNVGCSLVCLLVCGVVSRAERWYQGNSQRLYLRVL